MVGMGDRDEKALWRRWAVRGSAAIPAPDALGLAAYAEGRLSEAAAEPIEQWLAAHPAALDDIFADIAAARAAADSAMPAADAAVIAAACALVPGAVGNVVPLRRPMPAWRNALAWSSVAASLLAASLVGFAMGSDAYEHLSSTQSAEASSTDMIDAAATPESAFADDTGT